MYRGFIWKQRKLMVQMHGSASGTLPFQAFPIIFYNVLTALITHLQVINPALALTDGGPGKSPCLCLMSFIFMHLRKINWDMLPLIRLFSLSWLEFLRQYSLRRRKSRFSERGNEKWLEKWQAESEKKKAFNLLAFFIVLILAALVLLPIWWIFRSSLMSTATLNEYPPSFIPHEWLWSNYSKALETFEYWTYFKNTFTIIIPAVTFGTITAIFCGYAFARLRFRGKKLIFNICVGTILLPGMVTLIPLYIFLDKGNGTG